MPLQTSKQSQFVNITEDYTSYSQPSTVRKQKLTRSKFDHQRATQLNFNPLLLSGTEDWDTSTQGVCKGCLLPKLYVDCPLSGSQRQSAPDANWANMHVRKYRNRRPTLQREILELVHSDVCGPFKITSTGGARYFVTFVDDYSRKIWVYFLAHKN